MRFGKEKRLETHAMIGGERGFSLAEMLAVVALIGLVAGMGFYVADTGGWRASSGASDIARRLEAARSKAAFEQHDQRISFDTAAGSFSVHDDDNSNGAIDTGIGEDVQTFHLGTSASGLIYGYVAGADGLDGNPIAAAVTFSGTPPVVSFNALGAAQSGVIYLIPEADKMDSEMRNMRAITVNQATGRVRRWRYDATKTPGPWRLER